MYDKLQKIIEAYEDLEAKLGDPAVLADQKEYTRLAKEHARQGELVTAARKYISLSDQLKSAKDELKTESDPDLKEVFKQPYTVSLITIAMVTTAGKVITFDLRKSSCNRHNYPEEICDKIQLLIDRVHIEK